MTRSLPRPSRNSGIERARAKRTRPRSSNRLWATANRSAGPPTRMVVNRPSGSSRDVLTPIRRWMSLPGGERVERAAGRLRRRAGHARDPRAIVSISAGVGPGLASRDGEHEVRDGGRGVGTGEVAGGGGHHGVARGIGEQARDLDEPVRIEVLVLDQDRGPGGGEDSALRRWWPAACGYGTIAIGSANAADFGEGRGARRGPPRGRRRRAPRSSRRGGTGTAGSGRAAPSAARSRAASAAAYPASPVTCTTRTRSTRRGRAASTASLIRRTACEPPNTRRIRSPGRPPNGRPGLVGVHARDRPDRRAGHVARPRGRGPSPSPRSYREERREPGDEADAPARDHVALPEHARDPEHERREQGRDRDVAAGREDRRGAAREQQDEGLGDREAEADRVEHEVDVAARRAERAQEEAAHADALRRHERRLEAAVAAEPVELSRGGSCAKRPCDGEGRVDMTARSPARDQQAHRSRFLSRPSPATPTAGCRSRRS